MTGRTTTDSAVGMEASLEAGMHKETSAVEATGRLEEPPPAVELPINDPTNPAHRLADDLRRGRIPGYAAEDVRLVLESLRHSVEREAGLKSAADRLCMAADHYGVKHLDTDDMDAEAGELAEATLAMRDTLAKGDTR